jgi:hypothetical protein
MSTHSIDDDSRSSATGVEANARLTSLIAAMLVVLPALLGMRILSVRYGLGRAQFQEMRRL